MFNKIWSVLVIMNLFKNVSGSETWPLDKFGSIYEKSKYKGEKFPEKYLVPEKKLPTISDLNYYLKNIKLIVDFFDSSPNATDCNVALGMFLTKALLKRTIIDEGKKIKINGFHSNVNKIISKADNIISHFIYGNTQFGWLDLRFRFSKLFMSDEAQVYSVKPFNRNIIKKWLHSNVKVNDFIEEMDEATYLKENYVKLVASMDRYLKVVDSDECLSRISLNPEPINMELSACYPDPFCRERVLAMPSVAYSLSHRLVNIMGLRQIRRCYLVSERVDDMHMDIMCSNMYREAVYLARRGFFSRDLFLEHIALCGMLGYEEFHRRQWFHKAASWINEEGCIQEDRNFEINRTKIIIDAETDPKKLKRMRKLRQQLLSDECHTHPMLLLAVVLAHGVRHAAHFMPIDQTEELP